MFKITKIRFKEFVQFGQNGLIVQKAVKEELKQGLTNVQMKVKVEHAIKNRVVHQVIINKDVIGRYRLLWADMCRFNVKI